MRPRQALAATLPPELPLELAPEPPPEEPDEPDEPEVDEDELDFAESDFAPSPEPDDEPAESAVDFDFSPLIVDEEEPLRESVR
ncbi:hypothetical protein [Actinocatenispora rupis]|uniref:hypothetical protein n=1 Tax=Actinocatenispora rupis TaxID=519421 RepID=UPI0031F008A8